MGLIERARHLLSADLEARIADGAGESAARLKALLLEVDLLRAELEGWRADLGDERGWLDASREESDAEIRNLERKIRAALEADDERSARDLIAKKRDAVSIRSRLGSRTEDLQRRIETVDRELAGLASLAKELRRRRVESQVASGSTSP